MSTVSTKRIQSAYPRPIRRSSTNVRTVHSNQRPTTSMNARRAHSDILDLPAYSRKTSLQRSKTGDINSTTSTQLSFGILNPDEIESLLRSVDRNDTFIVEIDCLANYRKLVETINLRETPLDCKSLCALQQRENRIVQRNACRDIRFRSLLDALQPAYVIKVEEKENKPNDVDHNNVLEYQANVA